MWMLVGVKRRASEKSTLGLYVPESLLQRSDGCSFSKPCLVLDSLWSPVYPRPVRVVSESTRFSRALDFARPTRRCFRRTCLGWNSPLSTTRTRS